MNIASIHLTGDDKQIVAAAVGAILGAGGAYLVGLLVEKRVKQHEAKKEDQAKLREYARNITKAEICCQEVLVVLYDTERLLGQCAKQVQSGGWMMTLPRQITIGDVSALDFRNEQLITEWTTLRFRIDKLNHLVREFDDFYTNMVREYGRMALRGEEGVPEVIQDNDEALYSFALKVQDSAQNAIEAVKHVYAIVTAHAELSNYEQVRIKSVDQLSKFKVGETHYKKVKSKLNKRFKSETSNKPAHTKEAPPPMPPPITTAPAETPAPSTATS